MISILQNMFLILLLIVGIIIIGSLIYAVIKTIKENTDKAKDKKKIMQEVISDVNHLDIDRDSKNKILTKLGKVIRGV